MDPLSDILGHLNPRGILYFVAEFNPPWGTRVPAFENVMRFHLVARGEAYIRVGKDAPRQRLEAGDFALVPFGAEHELAHSETAPVFALNRVLEEAGFTGSGRLVVGAEAGENHCRMICGHFAFDLNSPARMLLAALPEMMIVRRKETAFSAWMDATLTMLSAEETGPEAGRDAIIQRATELLLLHSIRHQVASGAIGPGLLRGLAHPQLARALTEIHAAPHADWSVERLAGIAGVSRTVFAERFRAAIGETPLAYVTAWRLEKAHTLLAQGMHTVDAVAGAVGYASTPAFSRAYAARFGEPPGATRRAVG